MELMLCEAKPPCTLTTVMSGSSSLGIFFAALMAMVNALPSAPVESVVASNERSEQDVSILAGNVKEMEARVGSKLFRIRMICNIF